ncbi:hypothetical protein [Deinococcus marmoris]|uniref:hypothetical protein n=1 Tax=Deinococcus marmoris TaxID=249408 RepID=UPI00049564B3|nr:hypothetical protein [Deinococcus marmoris]
MMTITAAPLETLDTKGFMQFLQEVIIQPARARAKLAAPYIMEGSRSGAEQRISPDDMELLAAILTRQPRSSEQYGHDLLYAEVKSVSSRRMPYEYQYYQHGARQKLEAAMTVDHIYINWWNGAEEMLIRTIPGKGLADRFDEFRAKIDAAYPQDSTENARQRCRVNIPAQIVDDLSETLVEVREGKLFYASPRTLSELFPHRRW